MNYEASWAIIDRDQYLPSDTQCFSAMGCLGVGGLCSPLRLVDKWGGGLARPPEILALGLTITNLSMMAMMNKQPASLPHKD